MTNKEKEKLSKIIEIVKVNKYIKTVILNL